MNGFWHGVSEFLKKVGRSRRWMGAIITIIGAAHPATADLVRETAPVIAAIIGGQTAIDVAKAVKGNYDG